jgi:hypothetical protein
VLTNVPIPGQSSASPAASPTVAPSQEPGASLSCTSSITIRFSQGVFFGTVDSKKDECKGDRKVSLLRTTDKKPVAAGKTTTKSSGRWSLERSSARGQYFAKVAKGTAEGADGSAIVCEAARSKVVKATKSSPAVSPTPPENPTPSASGSPTASPSAR